MVRVILTNHCITRVYDKILINNSRRFLTTLWQFSYAKLKQSLQQLKNTNETTVMLHLCQRDLRYCCLGL